MLDLEMIKVILYTILSALLMAVCYLAYENYYTKKYLRCNYDKSWLRQLTVAANTYKDKYKLWPNNLDQLIGIDFIDGKSLVSRQGGQLGIPLPHYIYIKPSDIAINSNSPLIYLDPRCMEIGNGKTIVGYVDGHISISVIDLTKH